MKVGVQNDPVGLKGLSVLGCDVTTLPIFPKTFGDVPNVFGGADVSATSNKRAHPTGAFYETAVVENISTQQVNSQTDNMVVPAFDAARCSPIYKSTSKVQIRSCYALMIIKA